MTALRLFCFGYGMSAAALANRLQPRGWRIAGTCRTPEKLAHLSRNGVDPFLFDGQTPMVDAKGALADTSHVLISIPPDEEGDVVIRHHGTTLGALETRRWCGYLSTTGVYGVRDGSLVDETTPTHPTTERGKRRQSAEREWNSFGKMYNWPVHIFRLAGIYGPGRNALCSLRQGRARRINKPGQMFSRIHADDIAAVLDASITQPRAGAIYNVCDNEPAPPQDVVTFAASLLNIDPPPLEPFDSAGLSPMVRSFYSENKRVNNQLITRELGVQLAYPTYREGLRALAKQGEGHG